MLDNTYILLTILVICILLALKWAKYWGYTIGELVLYLCFAVTNFRLLQGVYEGTLKIPNKTILIAEVVIVAFLIIVFILIKKRLRKIASLEFYDVSDIRRRQRCKIAYTFLFATILCLLPVITASWGAKTLPCLDFEDVSERRSVIENFINAAMLFSMGMAISAIFADTYINRISSEIFQYKDVDDIENFCLYLRSFHDDSYYFESLLCKTFQKHAPVFAIGNPRQVLQPNGAYRIYVTDEYWQAAVNSLSRKAWVILLRVGQTDGTKWEVLNIFQSNIVPKVLFIVYSKADYQYLSAMFLEQWAIEMPDLDIADEKPTAFFVSQENGTYTIIHNKINQNSYVEDLFMNYLECRQDISNELLLHREKKRRIWKKIFDNTEIPSEVRTSLNWSCISPMVSMLYWPSWGWLAFITAWMLRYVTNSNIPVYLFLLITLLVGNRISWLSGNWVSVRLFLRHQRYEASIIWYSFVFSIILSCAYIWLYYTG